MWKNIIDSVKEELNVREILQVHLYNFIVYNNIILAYRSFYTCTFKFL